MSEELRNLMFQTEGNLSFIRTGFQGLLDTGYFTINGVMFSFSEDRWDLLNCIEPELRRERNLIADFSKVDDEDAKLKLKLWVYLCLNPYTSFGNRKMKTTTRKLVSLRNCYTFMESQGWKKFFVQPKAYMVEAYRKWLKTNHTYNKQRSHCSLYASFLDFTEAIWGLSQEQESIDILAKFDTKRLSAEQKARIVKSIPHEFYQRLYDFCKQTMDDTSMDISYRITSAVIILFSQTGLRRSELYTMEAQPIKKTMMEDRFGKPSEIKYVFAHITKSVRGKDTTSIRSEVPLTTDGEKAFNALMELCRERREQLGWDKLIVYPTKKWGLVADKIVLDTWLIKFYAHFHKELDTFNTQDKYPTLTSRCISGFHDKWFKHIGKKYGEDTVIVYPSPIHFRKTYATILYQNGIPVEVIAKLLHHYSPKLTETFYIQPIFNQKDFATSHDTYTAILKYEAKILGKKGNDFIIRMRNFIEKDDLACICESDDELVDYMCNNHPLHAKEVGFCLMSDLNPCTVRTPEERIMCAFNTCNNIGFLFYDVAEHYQQMKGHEKAAELNRQKGFGVAAQKEINVLNYLVKTFLVPEITETENEIRKHGKEQIIEWYPAMKPILDRFEEIKAEVMAHAKEVVA